MAKTLTGVVVSCAADKTIVVKVERSKTHPIYKKQFKSTQKFMAHDEENKAKLGDKVIISETKPISKRKRFALHTVLQHAGIVEKEAIQ
jgi:small subunit ribosomal protein S17